VTTLLQQNGEKRVEIAKPPLFSGKMEKVSVFSNAAYLYLSIKIMEKLEVTKMAWVLSYVQGRVVEA